ncbi:MAG: hypothetical protein ACTSSP_08475 [Candidatus Asgardarchaeia archaeon]
MKSEGVEDKEFTNLEKAKEYYNSLNNTKAFWDITKIPELIDAYHIVEKEIKED